MQKLPKLCRQKTKYADLAYVRLDGQKHYCGNYGTVEANEKYLRLISEWTANHKKPFNPKLMQ